MKLLEIAQSIAKNVRGRWMLENDDSGFAFIDYMPSRGVQIRLMAHGIGELTRFIPNDKMHEFIDPIEHDAGWRGKFVLFGPANDRYALNGNGWRVFA